MQRKDKALELFRQQFNCSQAVFTAYRQREVLDEESALKLSTIFGAGVACSGDELCGAVTGALLAISMQYGKGDIQAIDAKRKTYELGRNFMSGFKARMGSCSCESILGLNIGDPAHFKKAMDLKYFESHCVNAVKAACDLLEEIL